MVWDLSTSFGLWKELHHNEKLLFWENVLIIWINQAPYLRTIFSSTLSLRHYFLHFLIRDRAWPILVELSKNFIIDFDLLGLNGPLNLLHWLLSHLCLLLHLHSLLLHLLFLHFFLLGSHINWRDQRVNTIKLIDIKITQIREHASHLLCSNLGRLMHCFLRQALLLELGKTNLDVHIDRVFVSRNPILLVSNKTESNVKFIFGQILVWGPCRDFPKVFKPLYWKARLFEKYNSVFATDFGVAVWWCQGHHIGVKSVFLSNKLDFPWWLLDGLHRWLWGHKLLPVHSSWRGPAVHLATTHWRRTSIHWRLGVGGTLGVWLPHCKLTIVHHFWKV